MSLVCEGCFYTGGRGTPSYYFTQYFASSFMLVGRGWGSFFCDLFCFSNLFLQLFRGYSHGLSPALRVLRESPNVAYFLKNFKFRNYSPCRTARRPSLCPPWSAWWNPENNKNTHFDKYLLEKLFKTPMQGRQNCARSCAHKQVRKNT